MKKVLFINSCLTGGGSERVMCSLANNFIKNNINTEMVLLREKGPDTYKLDEKIKCYRFKYGKSGKISKFIQRIIKLRKILKKGKYDYVISFMYDINIITVISSFGLKHKIIVSERNDPSQRKLFRYFKLFEALLYKKCSNIVFQTEQVEKMFPGFIAKKSIVIPNPIRQDLPKISNNRINSKIVYAAGRLTKQKNFELLIETFKSFHIKFPEYKLKIFGKGPEEDKLEKIINEGNANDYIELCGFSKNLNEDVKDYKIYVSTSDYEGISNSMLEAIAMGIPSICTDCPVGGAALVIKDHINGILIEVNDSIGLYNSLVELASNDCLWKSIANESVKINETFSEKIISRSWIDLIK